MKESLKKIPETGKLSPTPKCIRSSTACCFRKELCCFVSAVTGWNCQCLPWSYTFVVRNRGRAAKDIL